VDDATIELLSEMPPEAPPMQIGGNTPESGTYSEPAGQASEWPHQSSKSD